MLAVSPAFWRVDEHAPADNATAKQTMAGIRTLFVMPASLSAIAEKSWPKC
jgi:hypothetical protein